MGRRRFEYWHAFLNDLQRDVGWPVEDKITNARQSVGAWLDRGISTYYNSKIDRLDKQIAKLGRKLSQGEETVPPTEVSKTDRDLRWRQKELAEKRAEAQRSLYTFRQ